MSGMKAVCLHCNRWLSIDGRGLCSTCYRTPSIRNRFPAGRPKSYTCKGLSDRALAAVLADLQEQRQALAAEEPRPAPPPLPRGRYLVQAVTPAGQRRAVGGRPTREEALHYAAALLVAARPEVRHLARIEVSLSHVR